MVNLQLKALALHVVQSFLESVEDKILNRGSNTTSKAIPGQMRLEWIFFYLFSSFTLQLKKESF